MQHLTPEYTFDPETESGLDVHAEAVKNYAEEYKKEVIADATLEECLRLISELQIDHDEHAVVGLRVLRAINERIDFHINRNR